MGGGTFLSPSSSPTLNPRLQCAGSDAHPLPAWISPAHVRYGSSLEVRWQPVSFCCSAFSGPVALRSGHRAKPKRR